MDRPAPDFLADVPDVWAKPIFQARSKPLVEALRQWTLDEWQSAMGISRPLAELNHQRMMAWKGSPSRQAVALALLAFDGDVYDGLQASTLNAQGWQWAQAHLRMLSGLYGLLRPMDAFQAYRLEMGTRMDTPEGMGLYRYWGDALAKSIQKELRQHEEQVVVQLASQEYFKALGPHLKGTRTVECVFEEGRAGQFKVISFFAKHARGRMARWCIDHRPPRVEDLQQFNEDGYRYCPEASSADRWVYRRQAAQP